MSSQNLTNVRTGVVNDISLGENTGRTSIFDKFGTKAKVSSLDEQYLINLVEGVFQKANKTYSNEEIVDEKKGGKKDDKK